MRGCHERVGRGCVDRVVGWLRGYVDRMPQGCVNSVSMNRMW